MKKAIVPALTLLLYLTVPTNLFAQNVGINDDGSAPDASAMLDVKSTDKGMLVPRVALTGTNDIATIPTPEVSLLIYNTATVTGANAISPGFYYWGGTAWTRIGTGAVSNNAWATTGNTAGTNDFVGTTNTEPLRFKQNNLPAGYIDDDITAYGINTLTANTTGFDNTAFGRDALSSNTTGGNNTAIGEGAMALNTSGMNNTVLGEDAFFSNTTGNDNTAVGQSALALNTSGNNNSAFGQDALQGNITGSFNSAFGNDALLSNTTGHRNSAFGQDALHDNTTGSDNAAFGENSLYSNTTGVQNSSFGKGALFSNTTGSNNSAFGKDALKLNTTGLRNVAFGNEALLSNTSGDRNSAFGDNALFSNTSGDRNSAFGQAALFSNTEYNNSAFGFNALDNMSGNSNNNSAFGAGTDIADGMVNATALGYTASVSSSHTIVLGNTAVSSIGGYAPWSNLSDERFKKNLKPLAHGLDFILKLEPITYHYNMQKLHGFMEQREGEAEEKDPEWLAGAMAKKAAIQYTGFSAQQVEAAAKAVGYDFSAVHQPENSLDHYSLAYAEFVVPLVKAVQEQQEMIDGLKKENGQLKKIIQNIQARLEALEKE